MQAKKRTSARSVIKTINRGIMVVLLFVFFGCVAQFADTPSENLLQTQRQLFLQAEQALKNNDSKQYYQLLSQLKEYPLYPYLLYEALSNNVAIQPEAAINYFLQEYADSPLADQLREQWFRLLVSKKQWQTILSHYSNVQNPSVVTQCLYMQALLATNQDEKTRSSVGPLWLRPVNSPAECIPVFNVWAQTGYLVDDLVWDRLGMALKADNMSLAKSLVSWLPENEQSTANLWIQTHEDPMLVLRMPAFDKSIKQTPSIVSHGLSQLAEQDPKATFEQWHRLASNYKLSESQQQEVQEAIALGLIKKDPAEAKKIVPNLPKASDNETVAQWRLQQYILQNNWQGLKGFISQLPDKQKHLVKWRYWYARSLDLTGDKRGSDAILKSLSAVPQYYGIFSAIRSGVTFPYKDEATDISAAERQLVLKNHNVERTIELYHFKRFYEANKEWWAAIDHMSDREDYVAAKIALEWGMNNIALLTGGRIKNLDDIQLLFPLLYKNAVLAGASKYNVEPAWIFAVIRQESRFNPEAKSPVGARGLMQLMPATAKLISSQKNVSDSSSNLNLLDPSTNINLGSAYLKGLFAQFNKQGVLATASYNAGPNNVKKWLPTDKPMPVDQWIEIIPFQETRNYVKNIFVNMVVYEKRLNQQNNLKQYLTKIPPQSGASGSSASASSQ
jgi:soluble lytic murein transglycosylase